MRRIGWLLLAALALWSLAVAGARAQSAYTVEVSQVDQSDFPTIKVYVAVRDEANQPVPSLTREQFQLKENGQPVEIIDFKGSGSVPLTMLLVIDRSGSMQGAKLSAATGAAAAFVDQMRAEDRVALMVFSTQVSTAQPFSHDKAALRRAIGGVQVDSGTAWYDAAWASLDEINRQSGRRGVILLSDGEDNREQSGLLFLFGSAGSRRSFDELIEHAAQQPTPVYVIGLGRRGSGGDDGIDEPRLQKLAEVTHGRYYFQPQPDQLRALYADLSAGFQKEYEITFKSANPANSGTWRDIDVSVASAGSGVTGQGRGAYLESHVLNLKSSLPIALVLLVPLIGALVLPVLRDRRRRRPPAPSSDSASAGAPPAAPPPWASDPVAAPPSHSARRPAFCSRCGAALRPEAKFCGKCGKPVSQPS